MKNIVSKFAIIITCLILVFGLTGEARATIADFRTIEADQYKNAETSVQLRPLVNGFSIKHSTKGNMLNKKEISTVSIIGKDLDKRKFRIVVTEGASFGTLYNGKNTLRGIISHQVTDGQSFYREINGDSREGKFINIFEVHGDREIIAYSFLKYSYQEGYVQFSEGSKNPKQVRKDEIQEMKDYALYNKLIDSFRGRNQVKDGLSVSNSSNIKQAESDNFYFGFATDSILKFLVTALQVVVLIGMLYLFLVFIVFYISMYLGIDVISAITFGSISINDNYDETVAEFKRKSVFLVIMVALAFSNKLIELIIYLLNLFGLYKVL